MDNRVKILLVLILVMILCGGIIYFKFYRVDIMPNDIELDKIDDSITMLDTINLILFVKDKTIVSYINYPRSLGDFDIHENTIYLPKKSKFNIVRENNTFIYKPI